MNIKGLLSVSCLLMCTLCFGQNVINPKGTKIIVDTSKWRSVINDIHLKNTGNVGIGISPPLYKLDIAAPLNPLRLTGLQSGLATDSIITEAAGVIRRVSPARFITDTSIYKYDGSLTGNRTLTLNGNTFSIATGGTAFNITGLTNGTTSDSVLTINSVGLVRRVSISRYTTDTSIYKYDGSLAGNRTLTLNGSTFSIATGGTAFNITGLANGTASDSILTVNSVGLVRRVSVSRFTTDTSIYKYDGNLTGNRIVTMAANNLTFNTSTGNFNYIPSGTGSMNIGTAPAVPSALVNMSSNTRGVLVPSMTSTQRIGINSPANGLLVYDNTTNCFWVYKGNLWVQLVSGAPTINTQSGPSYTLLASDNGSVLEFTSASAVTLTVPAGLPAGFQCSITQLGAGVVTVTGSGGVVVRNPYNYTKTAAQYSKIGIEIPSTANTAILSGDAL